MILHRRPFRSLPFLLASLAVIACRPAQPEQRYGFIARLGRDTISVESITRSGNRVVVDGVDRFPRVRRRHTGHTRSTTQGNPRRRAPPAQQRGRRSAAGADRGRAAFAGGADAQRWGAKRLIDDLVAHHQVAMIGNVGNCGDWNVCKTGLVNELRATPCSYGSSTSTGNSIVFLCTTESYAYCQVTGRKFSTTGSPELATQRSILPAAC